MSKFQSFGDSLPANPDNLEKKGYVRFDEETTDTSRWVWFKKRRKTWGGEHELEVAIRYELFIGDALGATYDENCDYSFNDVEVSISRIEPAATSDGAVAEGTKQPIELLPFKDIAHRTELAADEDAKRANELVRFQIYPNSLRELESLVKILCP